MNATGFAWSLGACAYLWTGGVLFGFPFGLLAGYVWAAKRAHISHHYEGDISITVPANADAEAVAKEAIQQIRRQQRRGLA